MSERLMLNAAAVAARMLTLLVHVEDAWGAPESPRFATKEMAARFDAAGHTPGGGLDGCEVCKEIAASLPGAIAQTMAPAEGQA